MMRFIPVFLLFVFANSNAAPNELPSRKAGLWEIKMQMSEMPQSMTSQHCVDSKTDNLLQQQGQAKQECSKNSVRKDGDKIIIETVCKVEGSIATSKAVFSGDFTRQYRGEINTNFAPPWHGMKTSKQTLESKWLGACKAGQKPGDVIIPGMGSMNLNEMMKNIPRAK